MERERINQFDSILIRSSKRAESLPRRVFALFFCALQTVRAPFRFHPNAADRTANQNAARRTQPQCDANLPLAKRHREDDVSRRGGRP